MSEILVKVDDVSKKFCRSLRRSLWYGIQDLGAELAGGSRAPDRLRADEFWALRDVSFELKRGESLGVIGRNGAGKTTLLKMLGGLIKPDHGRIEMRGRIGALIALGAGFNPILTGRENIYVNGLVLGLTKREIDAKLDDIIAFAEIGEFIDAPVQSYSSGMQVRLGFAVTTALETDVLILDEILAVGDGAFKYKCYRRIDEVRRKSAVIFVSHDMPSVARICTNTLVLAHGTVRFSGAATEGIEVYRRLNEEGCPAEAGALEIHPPLTRFEVAALPREIHFRAPLSVDLTVVAEKEIGEVTLRVNLLDLAGTHVASCILDSSEFSLTVGDGETRWRIEIASLPLKSGRYLVSFGLSDPDGGLLAVSDKRHEIRISGGHPGIVGECELALRSWQEIP
jgi:lipopolysaccharide transport system ATP-binding protein